MSSAKGVVSKYTSMHVHTNELDLLTAMDIVVVDLRSMQSMKKWTYKRMLFERKNLFCVGTYITRVI